MQLTSRELSTLAAEVDDLHHTQMRDFAELAADAHLDAARSSRRRFLTRAGIGAAAVAVTPATPLLAGAAAAAQTGDTAIAGFAQSVELAAVAVYDQAMGLLGETVRPVGELFRNHHAEHAAAFGSVAGGDARPQANQRLLDALAPAIAAAADEPGALTLAQQLENQATYTYAFALTALVDPAYAKATSTILPIEAQHAVVLGLAAGQATLDQFPTGSFEAAGVGDGSDPLRGLDPAAFG